MTAHALHTLRWISASITLGLCSVALAQVEDPAERSTTAAEAALTHYPAAGNTNYPSEPAQPLRFRPASERTEIGRATEQLLSAQRQAPAQHPRVIDGDQASRSYARYLKSFEFEIPEAYETGVKTGTND